MKFAFHAIPLAFLAVAFLSGSVAAQSLKIDEAAIDRAVEAEMKSQKIVGLAVAIIGKGKVVYTKGYGYSNLESKTEVTENTVFNWASNSKPVMAIAALQLVEQKKLDLDASIGQYISEIPEEWKSITTRQLLSHQSGMPHYSNGKIIRSGTTGSPDDELDPVISLRRFGKSPLIHEPGSQYDYSSYAYVLLTAIVQQAGKEPIQKQLESRIIKPLKLDSFQLDVPFDDQPNWSYGYRVSNNQPVAINDYSHAWKHGAGAYKSNIVDFAKFGVALMKNRLIRTSTASKMWTRQKLKSGKRINYGLGILVYGSGRNLKIEHGGSQGEVRTLMTLFPRQKHGVLLLCNTSGIDRARITNTIYRVLKAN